MDAVSQQSAQRVPPCDPGCVRVRTRAQQQRQQAAGGRARPARRRRRTFFVAAYSEFGLSTRCTSANGESLFEPYTEEDEAYTSFVLGRCLSASSSSMKQRTLARTYACGCCSEYRTPACAARFTTWLGLNSESNRRSSAPSHRSPSTIRTSGPYRFCSCSARSRLSAEE